MKRIAVVLVILALIPLVVSCASPKEGFEGTGKGLGSMVEGAARGAMEAGKGAGEIAGGTVEATTEILTGRGQEAIETEKDAFEYGGKGVEGAVENPLEGIAEGLKTIDEGIKKATGEVEDIK